MNPVAKGPAQAERNHILEGRARALAAPRAEPTRDVVPVFAFRVGGERYAVRAEEASQVLESHTLCTLAGAPRWLLGAIQARSRIVPVLDLRQLLGLEGGGLADATRVVVLDEGGEPFGLAVEAVEGRLELPRAELAPAERGPFHWVASDRLGVLDLEKLGTAVAGGGHSKNGP